MADKQYTLEIAGPQDLQEIDHFVNANFYDDMPLLRMFGLKDVPHLDPDQDPQPDDQLIFVVKAVSAECGVVGVAINRTKPPEYPIAEDTDPRLIEMLKFMDFVYTQSKISSLPERTIELYILSVTSDWRQRGIGKRLVEESVTSARQRGYEVMKVCCANEYTTMAVRSLGFKEFYKLAYSDYSAASGNDVTLQYVPPNRNFYVFIKNLQE